MNSDDDVLGGAPELLDMTGAWSEAIARMGTGDADTVLFGTCMAAGQVVPLHSPVDPGCFYVLSGRIEAFALDDTPRWQAVKTGHSVFIDGGVKHAIRNTADQPTDLMLATNNRPALHFRETSPPAAPGTELLRVSQP